MNAHRKVRPAIKPPLLCEFGWHKTDTLALWNDGYYFSKCGRCGQDLVRTAFGRWTAPRGFRVVWAAQPPAGVPPVRLVPEQGAGGTPPAAVGPSIAGATAIDAPGPAIAAKVPAVDPEAPRPVEPVTEPRKRTDPREMVGERSLHHLFPSVQDRDSEFVKAEAPVLPATPPASDPPALAEPATPMPEPSLSDEQPTPVSPPVNPNEETAADAFLTASAEEVDAAPAYKPLIPDFMDGSAPLEVPYDLKTGRILPPEERPATTTAVEAVPDAPRLATAARPAAAPRRVRVGERVRTAALYARAFVDGRASPAAKRATAVDPRAFVQRHAGLVAATVFGAFVVVAATIDRSDAPASYRPLVRDAKPVAVVQARPQRVAALSPTPAPIASATVPPPVASPDPTPPVTPPPVTPSPVTSAPAARPAVTPQPDAAPEAEPAPTPTKATVTASVLRCRAKADDDSATVRRLTRGVSVELVAGSAGPGWVRVSQNGERCWVSDRYLSRTRRA